MGDFKENTKPSGRESARGYGIQQVIDLMRSLPADLQTTDMVVRVIKRTLESASINVGAIIADATRREEQIDTRIRPLEEEIAQHQREIETRNSEITRLQTDLEEISWAKECLVRVEKKLTTG
jgi:chromosome segregation ATPase